MHCSHALLHNINSVFISPKISEHNGQDPISLKKLLVSKRNWEVRKEILGWMMDGSTCCIESKKTQKAIYKELKTTVQIHGGVPYKHFKKLTNKPFRAAIGITQGKPLCDPIDRMVTMQPMMLYWDCCPKVKVGL